MEKGSPERKQVISRLLEYWPLISSGPSGVDVDDKTQVAVVQQVLSTTGHYDGEIDGKYNPGTDGARWRFVKDVMKDPDFSFELIKQNSKDIGDMMEDLGLEEEQYG